MPRGCGALQGTGPRATGVGPRFFSVLCEGQALALRGPGRVFFSPLPDGDQAIAIYRGQISLSL